MPSKKRFLILGTGRSGSSLMCSILSDAGADFAMSRSEDWDPTWGDYEHGLLHVAEAWRSRHERIRNSILPDRLSSLCETRLRQTLTDLLERATYLKSIPLVGLVGSIHQLGYEPSILISYRSFQDYARSIMISRPHWLLPQIVDRYVSTYGTALLQLEIFGGCAVSYDELTSPDAQRWAGALGQVTGIPSAELLARRVDRVKDDISERNRATPVLDKSRLDPRVEHIEATLRSVEGIVVPAESERHAPRRSEAA